MSGYYHVCIRVLCLFFSSSLFYLLKRAPLSRRRALDGTDKSGWTSHTISIDLCVFLGWLLAFKDFPEQVTTIALPFGGRAQKIPPSLIAQLAKAEVMRLMSVHQEARETTRYGFHYVWRGNDDDRD